MHNFNRVMLKFLENGNKKNGGKGLNFIKNILKFPLIIISYFIIIFTKVKRSLYSKNFILKANNPGIFTISVGNVNMGGSGKTPLSYSIASYLYNYGLKPCIVSRGYGAKLKKKSISQAGSGSLVINYCYPTKHCF
ncbi:MAG: tetraacyldisaccharide 4'-kinase [bacterium]